MVLVESMAGQDGNMIKVTVFVVVAKGNGGGGGCTEVRCARGGLGLDWRLEAVFPSGFTLLLLLSFWSGVVDRPRIMCSRLCGLISVSGELPLLVLFALLVFLFIFLLVSPSSFHFLPLLLVPLVTFVSFLPLHILLPFLPDESATPN